MTYRPVVPLLNLTRLAVALAIGALIARRHRNSN